MLNKRINEIISGAREALVDEIKKELETNGGSADISVDLPGKIEDEPLRTTTISRVFVSKEGVVMVRSSDDLSDEVAEESLLDFYSLDEIIEIINAL